MSMSYCIEPLFFIYFSKVKNNMIHVHKNTVGMYIKLLHSDYIISYKHIIPAVHMHNMYTSPTLPQPTEFTTLPSS